MLRTLAIIALLVLTATALDADALARAERSLRGNDAAAALEHLSGYAPASTQSEQRLLRMRAVAHMRLQQPAAALPHLERLVAMAPREAQYRLELAVALGQLGQTERALYHIDLARSAGLAEDVDARAAAYARQLENPRVIRGQFSFAIVPESNAAKRTSASEVILFGLPFQINPDARAKPATGLELTAGVTATPQLAPRWRAQIGFATRLRIHGGKAPDDYHARLHAGLIHGFLETGQTHVQIFTTRRWLDKCDYSRSIGVSLRHARRLTAATSLSTTVLREHQTYRRGVKVQRNFATLGLTHRFNPQLEISLGARREHRNSAQSSLAGQLTGVSLGGQYRFSVGLQMGLNLEYDRNRFEDPHPIFLVTRRDNRRLARVEIANSNWNWRGFAPVLQVSAEQQRSNIVINDFTNLGATLRATRRF